MSQIRRAVIDVGTNSIKLLVADVAGHTVHPVWEDSKQTRLGQGFYETHQLQIEPIAYSANEVTDFARLAREHGAQTIRVIATSAARDAVNADELVSAIEAAAKLKVEIISGEQEADWAFQGVTSDPDLAKQPLLLLDVGGGSTQFILGQGGHKHFRHSFSLGAVRLMEKMPHGDPPLVSELEALRKWLQDFLHAHVHPRLDPELRSEVQLDPKHGVVQLVGVGGTSSILARMEAKLEKFDREQIEATRLSLERIHTHMGRLWSLPLEKRKQIVGLPKKRADVILTGTAIYEVVMEKFGFNELRVSTRGLRFAAVMDAI